MKKIPTTKGFMTNSMRKFKKVLTVRPIACNGLFYQRCNLYEESSLYGNTNYEKYDLQSLGYTIFFSHKSILRSIQNNFRRRNYCHVLIFMY
jgi:hypothetical protein